MENKQTKYLDGGDRQRRTLGLVACSRSAAACPRPPEAARRWSLQSSTQANAVWVWLG